MDKELVRELRDSACRVLDDHCRSDQLHAYIDGRADPAELWQSAVELGWLALAVPEEHGGVGGSVAELAALQEVLGSHLAPIPFLSTVLVGRALTLWPQPDVRARWLPKVLENGMAGAVDALDPNSSRLTIMSRDGYLHVNGDCVPVLGGDRADLFVVCTVTDNGPGLAILSRSPALMVEKLDLADRTRGVVRLRCRDLIVPPDQVISGPQASSIISQLVDEARTLIAGDCMGGAEAILDSTVEYLKIRTQFGKPIGSFQALKHRCADHKVKLEACKRLTQRAAVAGDSDDRSFWAGMAKFAACECFSEIAADAIQLHGGIGFTWQHDAHLFLKRALLNQMLYGDGARLQDETAARLIAGRSA